MVLELKKTKKHVNPFSYDFKKKQDNTLMQSK